MNQLNSDDAEPIEGQNAINAEPLVRFFGEQNIRKIFSKTWQKRDDGIKALENDIVNEGKYSQDEGGAFVNGVGAVRFTVQDKMASVAHKSI
jgi:hypothetical protein